MTASAKSLKKQMLVMRAALERQEFLEQVTEMRKGLNWTQVLRQLAPGIVAQRALPLAFSLFKRYPAMGKLVSKVSARAPSASAVLRYAGIALAVWRAWRLVQQFQASRRRP